MLWAGLELAELTNGDADFEAEQDFRKTQQDTRHTTIHYMCSCCCYVPLPTDTSRASPRAGARAAAATSRYPLTHLGPHREPMVQDVDGGDYTSLATLLIVAIAAIAKHQTHTARRGRGQPPSAKRRCSYTGSTGVGGKTTLLA